MTILSQEKGNEGKGIYEVVVTDAGKTVKVKVIDGQQFVQEHQDDFANAKLYKKTAIVTARQATTVQSGRTGQDSAEWTAEVGDWIIQNDKEDPYVYGSADDTVAERQAKFAEKYHAIPGKDNKYQSKGVIKAIQLQEDVKIIRSGGIPMIVLAGGRITNGGYGIAAESFVNTYEEMSSEEIEVQNRAKIQQALGGTKTK